MNWFGGSDTYESGAAGAGVRVRAGPSVHAARHPSLEKGRLHADWVVKD